MVKYRSSKATISNLEMDEVVIEEQGLIADHIVNFFSKLFNVGNEATPDLSSVGGLIQSRVREEDVDFLIGAPTKEEVKATVFAMDQDSVPGPDGFGGIFYTKCWEIMGKRLRWPFKLSF